MTLSEISTKFDISLSTLKDWRNPQSKKHKLFLFLQNSDEIKTGLPHIRLLQLLNRNIAKEYQFTASELYRCFKKKSYLRLTQREKIIISRLFKEGDIDDAKEVSRVLNIAYENIQHLFESSPYVNVNGFDLWLNTFGIQRHVCAVDIPQQRNVSKEYLSTFLQQRGVHV